MSQNKKMVEAITPINEDFTQWYTDICLKAELVDYSTVKGCVILRPYGYAIWENIMHLLDALGKSLYARAEANRAGRTWTATTMDEVLERAGGENGYIKTMWCGDLACEEMMKEKAGLSSRCMPFAQEHLSDVCPCCGKPAKAMVVWGKAY